MSRHHTARGMAVYLRAWRSRVVLEGFIGTGLITAGSLTPAYLPLNSPWWSRLGRMGLVGPTWRVVGTALALLGVGLLIDSWLRLRPGRQWERPRGIRAGMHPWAVLGVWGLPLLLAPTGLLRALGLPPAASAFWPRLLAVTLVGMGAAAFIEGARPGVGGLGLVGCAS